MLDQEFAETMIVPSFYWKLDWKSVFGEMGVTYVVIDRGDGTAFFEIKSSEEYLCKQAFSLLSAVRLFDQIVVNRLSQLSFSPLK